MDPIAPPNAFYVPLRNAHKRGGDLTGIHRRRASSIQAHFCAAFTVGNASSSPPSHRNRLDEDE
jgi:hypothetical protein